MSCQDAVVTRLTVARLFNLWNYEHERIEVTVEAAGLEGKDGSHIPCAIASPEIVLSELRNAIKCCEPVQKSYSAEQGEEIEKGLVLVWDGTGEMPNSNWVGQDVAKQAATELAEYRAAEAKRQEGFLRLRSLGRVSVNGGAS